MKINKLINELCYCTIKVYWLSFVSKGKKVVIYDHLCCLEILAWHIVEPID